MISKKQRSTMFTFLLSLILSLSLPLSLCSTAHAATLQGETQLSPDKDYYYDLNQDGKKEKIRYSQKEVRSYSIKVSLSINNKNLYTKTFPDALNVTYSISDLDTKDNYLDLFLMAESDSATLTDGYFQRYRSGKITTQKLLTREKHTYNHAAIYRIGGLGNIKGDGTFSILVDSPIYLGSIGSYFCRVPFTYKNGVIKAKKVSTYTLAKGSQSYSYVLKKDSNVMKSPDLTSKRSFQLKSGSSLKITKISIPETYSTASTMGFAYITDEQGRTGWLFLPAELNSELFQTHPAWG